MKKLTNFLIMFTMNMLRPWRSYIKSRTVTLCAISKIFVVIRCQVIFWAIWVINIT